MKMVMTYPAAAPRMRTGLLHRKPAKLYTDVYSDLHFVRADRSSATEKILAQKWHLVKVTKVCYMTRMSAKVKPFGDRIVLRGLRFLGVHGVNEDEKKAAQSFIIDMDAWLNMEKASETDNLNDTVSYTDLHRVIQEVVEGPHFDLLEALANSIANTIFCRFKAITDVRLRIGKPKVASKKDADYVGLEIFRSAPL
ncbi:hypothetical protein L7F22_023239 [Adiantum nelumboides]|nr:hypothetical protein [Adiantum nelumboides]